MDIFHIIKDAVLPILGATGVIGAIQKHLIPGKKINQFIPYLQLIWGAILAPVFHLPPEVGVGLGMASTGLHQLVKIPVKALTGKSI